MKQGSLEEQVKRLSEENAGLKSENTTLLSDYKRSRQKEEELQQVADKLTFENAYLRRQLFGRKSEKFIPQDPNQLKLDFYGLPQLPEEKALEQELNKEQEKEVITYERRKKAEDKKQPVRQQLPEHLPRLENVIEPKNLPSDAVRMGEEVSETLHIKPLEFYVLRTIRPKYALPENQDGSTTIIIAEMPSMPIPKSNAGASVLAHLLVGKYMDHLPFYRQIEIFKRNGLHLAASTINGWFAQSIDLLTPLYEELKRQVLSQDYIQVDESTIPVKDKENKGATIKGYHWIVRDPLNKQLFFHYDKGSRSQRTVIKLLRPFMGTIQSDGYGAYKVFENKQGLLLLGCWAHARRKFESALDNDKQLATYALLEIQKLYAIERRIQEEGLSFDQAKELRSEEAYPILVSFEKWLYGQKGKLLPMSLIGKAVDYTYDIFPRLARYVIDGRYKIDNNLAENGVRPLALGRKNFLFCGNHEAAERASIIYSLMGTCKLNDINPQEWLTDILERLPDHSCLRLGELLPGKWSKPSSQ